MKFQVGPVEVDLDDRDDRIVGHINEGRGFEPVTLGVWAQMCARGGIVLDVGGYSGLFSIAAAKMGCHAICVEPMPVMQERILENAQRNGVEVHLVRAACSDKDGEADLRFNNTVVFTAGASLSRTRANDSIRVKTVTVDTLMAAMPVSAIKIDVERHEKFVLLGAQATLRRDRPSMIVEALDESLRQKMVSRLLPGYRVVQIMDVRNLHLEPNQGN